MYLVIFFHNIYSTDTFILAKTPTKIAVFSKTEYALRRNKESWVIRPAILWSCSLSFMQIERKKATAYVSKRDILHAEHCVEILRGFRNVFFIFMLSPPAKAKEGQ